MKANMVQALNNALALELESNPKLVLLGEDVGVDGGVFRVTEGLQSKYGKDRVIDTPLAESAIIGTSIGMAAYGLHPVPEIQFSGFIYPGFDQLISHASRIRFRSRGRFSCPMTIRSPYGGGIKAPEHHSESTEALYIHTPGLKVVIPSNPTDAKGLLTSALREPDPVMFLEPLRVYRAFREEVPDEQYTIPLGRANVFQSGSDITIISWGAMFRQCVDAVKEIQEEEKLSIELIDLRSLSPIDWPAVHSSVQKTGRCVVVQEAPLTLGLASEIMARILEKNFLHLKAPVERVTGFDTIMPLFKLENYYLPSAERIKSSIRKVMQF
ncbi:MAG: alpha-ketoacid dehydrogenase subunit beta [Candidatus Diapherotrites archaeon]|uniref:3-methyl-2-oxobutanoate dehydrogenase (2-methylpropanoyl-transferring) n=1 Tax=Candidatus Iainarchaeum sp. TaxID=3101447 RepID=A0A8T4C6Q2_9ARCH|nr:alpha-ketoacid dehydrogenase subunit beta [Candidatus Diapherotrites archaeon]